MQLCILLFNAATVSYRKIIELHKTLHTTNPQAAALVENSILNKQAWKELESYNSQRKFLYKHPLAANFKTEHYIRSIAQIKPSELLNIHDKRKRSLERYESISKNKKYPIEERKKAVEHILRLRAEMILIENTIDKLRLK